MGPHPAVFDIETVTKASSHDGGSPVWNDGGDTDENDETASVRRVSCRVATEASLK